MSKFSVLLLLATLQLSSPAFAETDVVASANATGGGQAGIFWMSGGIGDEALSEMRRAAAGYNVHMTFSDRTGAYLAGIRFKVSGRNGQAIYEGVTDGPLLYLKLSPGSYLIAAEIDQAWQTRRIQVAASGRPTALRFVADSE